MNEAQYAIQMALDMAVLVQPVIGAAIRALQLPAGSRGLDAGCGVGLHARQLADAVGPAGQVVGLDLSAEALACAQSLASQAGLSQRIIFRQADVTRLPFADDTYDWAWSTDCVGLLPIDPIVQLRELARVVRPGGRLAILAWSSELLLPGYPVLEARLRATASGIAPFVVGRSPRRHFLRALGWLAEIGLLAPSAATFVGSVHAPLTDSQRRALVALFSMRWVGAQSELAAADSVEYERLCLPQSPHFIVDQPDYYAFFTYSMFTATLP